MSDSRQSGNVLFLILIAVVLFAALSFAVTQTSQNSSGNADRQADQVNFAALMNYLTSIRTRVERMKFSDGIINPQPFELSSNTGATVYSDTCDNNPELCLFGPEMPFYRPERVNAIFKLDVQNAWTRLYSVSGRLYAYFIYAPVDQGTCEAFNDQMGVEKAPITISNEGNWTAIVAAMEEIPAKCLYFTGEDENMLFMNIYDAELV